MKKERKIRLLNSAKEAAALVEPGNIVCASMMDSIPNQFLDALADRVEELPGLKIWLGSLGERVKLFDKPVVIDNFFYTAQERVHNGPATVSYVPSHLSDTTCGIWDRGDIVAVLQTTAPDENGMVSTGAVPFEPQLLEAAKTVIFQINKTLPYVYGEDRCIPMSCADAYYYHDVVMPIGHDFTPSPEESKIAQLIAERVPDGACIQLGIGTLGDAVGKYLKDKKDLGIHTEVFTDPMIDLIECGAVNNSLKAVCPGKTVFGAALPGSRSYPFLDRNKSIEGRAFSFVNDSRIIAQNKKVLSVNGALQVDLFGQVCAETIGFKQFSGTGGQLDFVHGARWSEGGMSFIAFPSARRAKDGSLISKISLTLPVGSAVTTPRSDVQYIATEYGIALLRGLTLDSRARALIEIAHPEFRDQLKFDAKKAGIII